MEECFTKINTPPWVFFTFLKLYKCYQIAQRTINDWKNSTLSFKFDSKKRVRTWWSKVNILFVLATQPIDFGICYVLLSIKAMIVMEPAANEVFELDVSIIYVLSFLDGRRTQEKGKKFRLNSLNQDFKYSPC